MELDSLKMSKTQKTIFLILVSLFFTFFAQEVLAQVPECVIQPGWNNQTCYRNATYWDTGGSRLGECLYYITSGVSPACNNNGPWQSACDCYGLNNITCPIIVSIGPDGVCNVNGEGTCLICVKYFDRAENESFISSRLLNIDFAAPSVSVTGAPVSWQNTDATANVSCSDAHSGCDSTTYRLKIYTTDPGTCPTNYADYNLTAPQTVSSHCWVCGAAKDIAGNAGFSSPVEFKVLMQEVLAQIPECVPQPGWNNQTCYRNATYWDTGGAHLKECLYNIQTGASPICPYNGTWQSACNCCCESDEIVCPIIVSIGPDGVCNVNGEGTCKICAKVLDNAIPPNPGYFERLLNIDFADPNVSVTGAPVSWQNTDATANISCSDAHSGYDSATYKLKIYNTDPGTCPTDYAVYNLTAPQIISSHCWVCGAAKDIAGNAGFSSPVEFKVDKLKPVPHRISYWIPIGIGIAVLIGVLIFITVRKRPRAGR
jgi:hypothetical protein